MPTPIPGLQPATVADLYLEAILGELQAIRELLQKASVPVGPPPDTRIADTVGRGNPRTGNPRTDQRAR